MRQLRGDLSYIAGAHRQYHIVGFDNTGQYRRQFFPVFDKYRINLAAHADGPA
jgi:hypothetical protein